jgi:hypothetical protein
MATNYANDRLTAAIKSHLLSVDILPPNAEISRLAGELARVCVHELSSAGLSTEAVEKLFAPAAFKARARGIG